MQINDILDVLKSKYNLPKAELERIIDTQFKVVYDSMNDRSIKSIKLINLGKIKPSTFLINNHGKFSKES